MAIGGINGSNVIGLFSNFIVGLSNSGSSTLIVKVGFRIYVNQTCLNISYDCRFLTKLSIWMFV